MTVFTNNKCRLYYLTISKVDTISESSDCADRIYPVEPEVKDTIDIAKYASYRGLPGVNLILYLFSTACRQPMATNGFLRLIKELYDTRDYYGTTLSEITKYMLRLSQSHQLFVCHGLSFFKK